MSGKSEQAFVDMISELRAGRSVHFVAASEAEAETMRRRVAEHVTPDELSRFTADVPPRSREDAHG